MPGNPISDTDRTAIAWTRFRRLIRWTGWTAMAAVVAAFAYLIASGSELRIHMLIATAAGVGLSVMLGGGLMALVFLSSGSGHDEDAAGGQQ